MGALLGAAAPWAQAADTPAAPAAAAASVLSLQQVLQAARQNPDAMAAQRAAEAARADVQTADRAPAPTLSAGVSSIDLQNGVGSGSFWTQKRLDKSLGLDWTWERGNKRALRTEVAERSARLASLTEREREVLLRVAKGFTLPEIGVQLTLSRHTIADYVKQIYRKLNVSSRAEAALEAQRLGLFGRN